jgi:shikimate dehydrogenase
MQHFVVGLIGHPVAHSRSPALQQAAFDARGVDARYVLWDTPAGELAERVASLRQPGMLGANVTIPHKSAVPLLMDRVTASARRIGAVNTIVREESGSGARLVGHNTDVAGLREALHELHELHELHGLGAWRAGPRMLILGTGGAARAAIAVAGLGVVGRAPAEVRLAARDLAAGRALLEAFHRPRGNDPAAPLVDFADPEALAAALRLTDLVINATSVGMGDADASPLSAELLRQLPSGACVFDMVYAPPQTALVRTARALGLRAGGGLPMLLYQGAEAFTLWTGQPAPLSAMRAALGLDNDAMA